MRTNILSLFELNKTIQDSIREAFPDTYWVTGEISELKINASGHCYIELIEKDSLTDKIIARARAIIWAYTYRMLGPYFEFTTGRALSAGLKVLLSVSVQFHELYGFSLLVNDIDPTYTIGDLARRKAETIARLEKEGVLYMNRELPFPLVPQRIAVVSSKTAAGYQDFIDQLVNNDYGFRYDMSLFPAVMQGEEAPSSLIGALEKIAGKAEKYDVVVIVRGGGAQSELSIFDDYRLASHVAQFPLPVLTGIGHEKDEPVLDIVAHRRLKTPTAVAGFIIDQTLLFDNRLDEAADKITDLVRSILNEENDLLADLSVRIPLLVRSLLHEHSASLEKTVTELLVASNRMLSAGKNYLAGRISETGHSTLRFLARKSSRTEIYSILIASTARNYLEKNKHRLELSQNTIALADPQKLLEKGYSITYYKGQILKTCRSVVPGNVLITRLADGKVQSTVTTPNDPSS
ncbi:MAG: exodeoxyribonuclease VII large subunit [Bacteroidales bacterium]